MRILRRLCCVVLGFAANSAGAAIYTVNSNLDLPDADPSDGACATSPPPVCTLRAAVMQANANPGPDYISLPAGTYVLSRVGYDATANQGDLDITDDVTIYASGGTAVIDANRQVTFDRAFEVVSGSLSLQNITLTNGYSPGNGGAIYAKGNLSLANVSILDNMAASDGGGIAGDGSSIQITASTIQGNTAQGNGGAISIQGNGSPYPTLSIVGSEIAGNQALGAVASGGGVNAYTANIVVKTSNVHDNSAHNGGGLSYIAAVIGVTMQISDSIFDHNSAGAAGSGGGLYAYGNDTTNNTVISNNSAGSGAGMYAYYGTHNLTDVSINGNSADSAGGGIELSSGNVNLLRGQVHGNSATQLGGGIAAGGLGSILLAVTDSSVFDNKASDGGAIWSSMKLNATSSAIYHNYAQRGGGVFASGPATAAIDNSIVDGNSAGSYGGGVFADSTATVRLDSATITSNYARTGYPSPGTGGGIYVTAGASATAVASVLAYNTNSTIFISPNDCSGILNLGGYSFVGSNSGCTVVIQAGTFGNSVGGAFPSNVNPQLSAFERLYDPALPASPNASAKYGRVPLSGSPLIDAGTPGGCQTGDGAYLFWDEIGQFRSINGRCDIGAIEFGAALDEIFGNGFDA